MQTTGKNESSSSVESNSPSNEAYEPDRGLNNATVFAGAFTIFASSCATIYGFGGKSDVAVPLAILAAASMIAMTVGYGLQAIAKEIHIFGNRK